MLVFVSSLRHPQNAASYQRVGELLLRTLHSVHQQTSDQFKMVIVCNEVPPQDFSAFPKVEFVPVNFPPPTLDRKVQTGATAVLRDKGSKLAVGILAANALAPSHFMFLDADDLIHRGIVAFVEKHPREPGWYFNTGYVHQEDTGLLRFKKDFNLCNGSSHIINMKQMPIPAGLTIASSQDEIIAGFGEDWINNVIGGHPNTYQFLREHGIVLEPMPFPGAVWMIGTGENHSGSATIEWARPPRRSECQTYGLAHRRFGFGDHVKCWGRYARLFMSRMMPGRRSRKARATN